MSTLIRECTRDVGVAVLSVRSSQTSNDMYIQRQIHTDVSFVIFCDVHSSQTLCDVRINENLY